jgi:hypothetical protein
MPVDRARTQYEPKVSIKRLDQVTLLDSEETSGTSAVNKKGYVKDLHKMEVVNVNGNMTLTSTQGYIHFRNVAASDIEVNLELDSIEVGEKCKFEQTGTETITIVTDEGGLTINSPSGLSTSEAGDTLIVFKYASTAFNIEVYKAGAFATTTYVDTELSKKTDKSFENIYAFGTSSDSGVTFTATTDLQTTSGFPLIVLIAISETNDGELFLTSNGDVLKIRDGSGNELIGGELIPGRTYIAKYQSATLPSGIDAIYLLPEINKKSGVYNYQDTATAITPISVVSSTWTTMTNNILGALSLRFPASGVSDVWNYLSNRFDFSQLTLGSSIMIRFHLTITTTSANQIVRTRGIVSEGVLNVEVPTSETTYKTAGTHDLAFTQLFTVLTETVRDNPIRFELWSDDDLDVVVQGWN